MIQTEKQLVADADKMLNADFIRHMNIRHKESLGYLLRLSKDLNPDILRMWRAYHAQLHRWRIDLEHYHTEA